MTSFETVNYMSADESLVRDPYPYYDYLRAQCPVQRVDALDVVAVTGREQLATIQKDTVNYSSANCLAGMFMPLTVPEGCEDLGETIEAARAEAPVELAPLADVLVSLDPPVHTNRRFLLKSIFAPKRLRENEEFMWQLADQQIDEFIDKGSCELLKDFAQPFASIVVAQLLGVPESDFQTFRENLSGGPLESMGEAGLTTIQFLENYFAGYVEERRRSPRGDVLTQLADARYPDGTVPEPLEVGRVASFLFAAGGDTTSGLILSGMRVLAEQSELQDRLRREPDRIADFVEETLRYDGIVKTTFRMARRNTEIDGMPVPIGTTMMLLLNAANRDPDYFADPNEFDIDRSNVREHLAFGRGPHACAGAPFARAEARVTFSRFLTRMSDIRLSVEQHGSSAAPSFTYEPSYVLRRLQSLNLTFTPTA